MVSFARACGRFDQWPLAGDFDAIGKEFHGTVSSNIHVSVFAFCTVKTAKGEGLQNNEGGVRQTKLSICHIVVVAALTLRTYLSRNWNSAIGDTKRNAIRQALVRDWLQGKHKNVIELKSQPRQLWPYPMFTPSILARNLDVNQSALPPFVVYTDAAFPNGLSFSISMASSQLGT